jgi:threonine dehydrogenase-like Zn-dependent dehydrogenase
VELVEDYTGQALDVGSKVALPPLMPCGECHYCRRYPDHANKCLNPTYYGRYLPFDKPPHLWGGWAEMVYVDLDMLPATKIYRLPDSMSCMLGSLSEPLACCIRALNRAVAANGFRAGDTVVIQGSGPIGLLMVVAAREMGAGRIVVVGAPEEPRLALCREFGADATVSIETHVTADSRVEATRAVTEDLTGNAYGADLAIDCSGHPSAGPEGIEMLRDGGTYIEMGQFTDAGPIETNWHRICTKDIQVIGSWGITANEMPMGIDMLERAADKYPWDRMQVTYPFSEQGISAAIGAAMAMECVKATIVHGTN